MKLNKILAGGLVLAVLAAPLAFSTQQPAATAHATWEYKVVGLTEMHKSALDYLTGAWKEKGTIAEKLKATDEQMAQKTEDLLNELGAEGWELLHHSNTVMVLKRPGQ